MKKTIVCSLALLLLVMPVSGSTSGTSAPSDITAHSITCPWCNGTLPAEGDLLDECPCCGRSLASSRLINLFLMMIF